MAITTAIANSFKVECFRGIHDFSATGDVIKCALYSASATMDKNTTTYATTAEVSGTAYVEGGVALTNITPVLDGDTAVCDWSDPAWAGSAFTVRGYMLYNSSQGNRMIKVEDFGANYTSVNQTFQIILPNALAGSAAVRMS